MAGLVCMFTQNTWKSSLSLARPGRNIWERKWSKWYNREASNSHQKTKCSNPDFINRTSSHVTDTWCLTKKSCCSCRLVTVGMSNTPVENAYTTNMIIILNCTSACKIWEKNANWGAINFMEHFYITLLSLHCRIGRLFTRKIHEIGHCQNKMKWPQV